ncbi:MAG: tRNA (cytidine(34)-2'-O)-methyltransferase [Phycisphaerales bacterium]|nr:tRNA (cytidine(34)-2'-O)-methyltransferase [Phycisphaerales bacterium]
MDDPALNLVLYQPQIPNNTGNIGRTALATGSRLHIIHPIGFSMDAKARRRAGLDYWEELDVVEHEDWAAYLEATTPRRLWLYSTKATCSFRTPTYERGDHLLFGPEDAGVPPAIHDWVQTRFGPEHSLRIPMVEDPAARSLNLATAVAIAAYEALRGLPGGF